MLNQYTSPRNAQYQSNNAKKAEFQTEVRDRILAMVRAITKEVITSGSTEDGIIKINIINKILDKKIIQYFAGKHNSIEDFLYFYEPFEYEYNGPHFLSSILERIQRTLDDGSPPAPLHKFVDNLGQRFAKIAAEYDKDKASKQYQKYLEELLIFLKQNKTLISKAPFRVMCIFHERNSFLFEGGHFMENPLVKNNLIEPNEAGEFENLKAYIDRKKANSALKNNYLRCAVVYR